MHIISVLVLFVSVYSRYSTFATAPEWPLYFVTNWTIYNVPHTDPWPPYDAPPPLPYSAGRGRTYYDWTISSMLEVYDDFCVPIFQNGSQWKCHFLNTKGVSYLISSDPKSFYPPCCVFGKPWSPPAPNFLQNRAILENGTSTLDGRSVSWWVMNGTAEEGAPFGYGFYGDTKQNWRIPAAFYFRGFVGWTQQNFFDWSPEKPSSSVFDVPSQCNNAPDCNYL